jgi:Phosphoribosyl transferase domain
MSSKLDNLLPMIIDAHDSGLTVGAIKAKFIGKSSAKAKDREVELREKLAELIREGAIWGPLKHGVAQYYFAAGQGPSIETASAVVVPPLCIGQKVSDVPSFMTDLQRKLAEIERRRQRYLGSRERVEVAGRTAIVIDDGIATGATTRAALGAARLRKPKKLILAVPVAPTDSLAAMQQEADEVVCLEAHTDLGAIGYCYSNFWPVPDDEVIELLARFSARKQKQSSHPAA